MLWINCEGSVWLSMIRINCGGSVRFAMDDLAGILYYYSRSQRDCLLTILLSFLIDGYIRSKLNKN